MPDPDTFGARLRRLREQAGLSVYALAQRSGVSKQALAKLEAGTTRPLLATAEALAHALGLKSLKAWDGCAPSA